MTSCPRDPMRSFSGDGVAKGSTRVVEAGRAQVSVFKLSFAIDGAGAENGRRLRRQDIRVRALGRKIPDPQIDILSRSGYLASPESFA